MKIAISYISDRKSKEISIEEKIHPGIEGIDFEIQKDGSASSKNTSNDCQDDYPLLYIMPPPSIPSRLVHRRGARSTVSKRLRLGTFLSATAVVVFILLALGSLARPATTSTLSSISPLLSSAYSSPQNCAHKNIANHTVRLWERPCQPIPVAFAISMIKCGDFQSSPEGLVDAALVLRHSVHQTSSRVGSSKYDYQMFAIVHNDAKPCSQLLVDAGFQVVFKDRPVEKDEIRGEFLRKMIHREWCCGHDEFIKLYAYELPSPLVVHVDIDFIMKEPMDDLFDALLFHKDSPVGKAARGRIHRERPSDSWPDEPQAMMTRDWPQVFPGRKAGYQAGFLVARTNPKIVQENIAIIKEGHFVDGFSPQNGWGGAGYGAFVGAMAMQGLLAYYYDMKAPGTWVELNQCRYNHMGMTVLFSEGGPGYRSGNKFAGKCRNTADACEDCRTTKLQDIFNIHYTMCRKPWMCIGESDAILPQIKREKPMQRTSEEKKLIPESSVHLDHCMELLKVWHGHREDLEKKLLVRNQEQKGDIESGFAGEYKREVFAGHCRANGDYITLAQGNVAALKQISMIYD